MQLTGKRVVVTGGASGIGAAMVGVLVREGALVASMDVNDEAGQGVVDRANADGPGRAGYHHCDVSVRADVESAFAAAASAMGGMDALVNAAGIEHHLPPEDIDDAEWDRMIAVNLTGTFLTNQVAFRHLRDGGGRILNFGSDAGLINYSEAAHYSATKGAVMSWTRSVAACWGRYGITVNSMVPAIWTPMYDAHRAIYDAEQLAAHDAAMAQVIAVGGRLGDPVLDLAPVIVFMLGDGARFITGQIISVNGGANPTR